MNATAADMKRFAAALKALASSVSAYTDRKGAILVDSPEGFISVHDPSFVVDSLPPGCKACTPSSFVHPVIKAPSGANKKDLAEFCKYLGVTDPSKVLAATGRDSWKSVTGADLAAAGVDAFEVALLAFGGRWTLSFPGSAGAGASSVPLRRSVPSGYGVPAAGAGASSGPLRRSVPSPVRASRPSPASPPPPRRSGVRVSRPSPPSPASPPPPRRSGVRVSRPPPASPPPPASDVVYVSPSSLKRFNPRVVVHSLAVCRGVSCVQVSKAALQSKYADKGKRVPEFVDCSRCGGVPAPVFVVPASDASDDYSASESASESEPESELYLAVPPRDGVDATVEAQIAAEVVASGGDGGLTVHGSMSCGLIPEGFVLLPCSPDELLFGESATDVDVGRCDCV